jgi:transposase
VQGYSVWRRALGITGQAVIERVEFDELADEAVVSVRPYRAEPLRCGRCGVAAPGFDQGEGRRRWRALDFGPVRVSIEAAMPRVLCPEHGPTVIAVPWARHKARHTRYFDETVAWLARHCAKSMVAFLLRIAWETVGAIITRVMAEVDGLGVDRFANVRRIGIDEVSYQRGHKYLVVVVDHANGRLLWVGKGRTKKTLGAFFDALGEEGCRRIALVSADGADWIADMVGLRCPNAEQCVDPFHVVSWVVTAVDKVRRRKVGEARRSGDKNMLTTLSDARWAVLKNPDRLNPEQRAKLADIQKVNSELYRAYLLKEQFRQIFAPGGEERIETFDEWMTWASRCRIPELVEAARKMRRFRDDIANTLTHRLTNAIVEGLNSRVRLIINIARGFRSPEALMALMQLHLGVYQPHLPGRVPTPRQLQARARLAPPTPA